MKDLSSPSPRKEEDTLLKSTKEDKVLDATLRPKTWEEYIGQAKTKKNIQIIVQAARKRGQAPDHLLFYGTAGVGKTSLAHLIAKEIGANIKATSGPAISKVGDLAAILTNLEENNILFVDECHRINKLIEEFLYPAMEDFKLNLILGTGPMARTMELEIPRFTLIGATTRLALLSSPLRNRFGATFQLNFYELEDIKQIIERSANILGVDIKKEAVDMLANCSRFTPRVANRLLKRTRDFAQIEGKGVITKEISQKTLEFLEIDELGLEQGDKKILKAIIHKFSGGPVGLQTLAAATSEETDTILEIYEPYLMQLGFIERTSRGRMATKLAYQHLGIKHRNSQKFLL